MPYYLDSHTVRTPAQITIVGCGATGGFVAESLCRILTGTNTKLMLVDDQRVEPENVTWENFHHYETGHFKSQALAERCAKLYRRTVGYSTYPFTRARDGTYTAASRSTAQILIGCLDNQAARVHMQDWLAHNPAGWLIDVAKDTNGGRVLTGNTSNPKLLKHAFAEDLCLRVPAPGLQDPGLLGTERKCAAWQGPPHRPFTDEDPTTDHVMAALTLQTVHHLIKGTCTYMALYLHQRQGTLSPVRATPQAIHRIRKNCIARAEAMKDDKTAPSRCTRGHTITRQGWTQPKYTPRVQKNAHHDT